MSAETYRAIIVDDEDLARSAVLQECRRLPELDVVGEAANGFEAVKLITELSPDIVFLDIQMPKLNGFEVLELVDGSFAVVFVTAHDEHALRAFDANAIDYLLKPFPTDRFTRAVAKAIESVRSGKAIEMRQKGASIGTPKGLTDRILVRDGARVHVLPIDAVSHIEAQDDYIAIVSRGKRYLKQQTMTSIESQLPPDRFVRVHRSSLLNLDFLSKIELYAKDSRVAVLSDGSKIHVSRSGYEKLKGFLKS